MLSENCIFSDFLRTQLARVPMTGMETRTVRAVCTSGASAAAAEGSDYAGDAASCDTGVQGARTWRLDMGMKVNTIVQVVSNMNPAQRNAVVEMGFGGFLYLKFMGQVDNRFGFWLMMRVDPDRRGLVTGDGSFLPLTEELVGLVLGVDGGRKKIPYPAGARNRDLMVEICELLGLGCVVEKITVPMLENILLPRKGQMTSALKRATKVAFALLCDGCLFNPVMPRDAGISCHAMEAVHTGSCVRGGEANQDPSHVRSIKYQGPSMLPSN